VKQVERLSQLSGRRVCDAKRAFFPAAVGAYFIRNDWKADNRPPRRINLRLKFYD